VFKFSPANEIMLNFSIEFCRSLSFYPIQWISIYSSVRLSDSNPKEKSLWTSTKYLNKIESTWNVIHTLKKNAFREINFLGLQTNEIPNTLLKFQNSSNTPMKFGNRQISPWNCKTSIKYLIRLLTPSILMKWMLTEYVATASLTSKTHKINIVRSRYDGSEKLNPETELRWN
jgi:hypothetical protein